jgi:hypothetical protein
MGTYKQGISLLKCESCRIALREKSDEGTLPSLAAFGIISEAWDRG